MLRVQILTPDPPIHSPRHSPTAFLTTAVSNPCVLFIVVFTVWFFKAEYQTAHVGLELTV